MTALARPARSLLLAGEERTFIEQAGNVIKQYDWFDKTFIDIACNKNFLKNMWNGFPDLTQRTTQMSKYI